MLPSSSTVDDVVSQATLILSSALNENSHCRDSSTEDLELGTELEELGTEPSELDITEIESEPDIEPDTAGIEPGTVTQHVLVSH